VEGVVLADRDLPIWMSDTADLETLKIALICLFGNLPRSTRIAITSSSESVELGWFSPTGKVP